MYTGQITVLARDRETGCLDYRSVEARDIELTGERQKVLGWAGFGRFRGTSAYVGRCCYRVAFDDREIEVLVKPRDAKRCHNVARTAANEWTIVAD